MLPNFLIIGTAKAATSALYEYLREHPQVFMPRRKEFHRFATRPHLSGPVLDVALHDSSSRYDPVVDRDEYERYFRGRCGGGRRGIANLHVLQRQHSRTVI